MIFTLQPQLSLPSVDSSQISGRGVDWPGFEISNFITVKKFTSDLSFGLYFKDGFEFDQMPSHYLPRW